MNYLNAFLCTGLFCFVGQLLLDNTKMTPGHLTSLYTVLGAILAFFGLYEPLSNWAGAGASVPITNFGNMLFIGGLEGFNKDGILGLFTGLLSRSSAAIVSAIVFSFVVAIFFKPKD